MDLSSELFWFDYSFVETIVKLPKDTASGYKKLFKNLTSNYYKVYGGTSC